MVLYSRKTRTSGVKKKKKVSAINFGFSEGLDDVVGAFRNNQMEVIVFYTVPNLGKRGKKTVMKLC